MKNRGFRLAAVVTTCCFIGVNAASAFVFPTLGGGQDAASMKHVFVGRDGHDLTVRVDDQIETPVLRPLPAELEFDPAMPYSVLQNKAYNLQYGWLIDGIVAPLPGKDFWIEHLSGSPELETYYVAGLPNSPPYDPIFGTDGSPLNWKWDGSMVHNAYAVLNPIESSYEATYRIYIGDSETGVEDLAFQSAQVTLNFDAIPVLPADFDDDGDVDGDDFLAWQTGFGITGDATKQEGDANADGDVDGDDFLLWQSLFGAGTNDGQGTPPMAGFDGVPEPATATLLIIPALLIGQAGCRRRMRS